MPHSGEVAIVRENGDKHISSHEDPIRDGEHDIGLDIDTFHEKNNGCTPKPAKMAHDLQTDVAGISKISVTEHICDGCDIKRQLFWRNVVKQFNFTDERERDLILSLTHGISWMKMKVLPQSFILRHREIYFLISRAEYQRSGSIRRDVTRTFSIFERSQLAQHDIASQQQALFRVLNAVAEAEDGYCQGMNFIAALFLVEGLAEADAYALFVYLLKKRHLARIYHHNSTFLDDYLHHFNMMLQKELPDLYQHFVKQGFAIPMYGIEWFTTMFSLSTKQDLACAIFDMFFVGVQDIFLRMGLAILKLLEAKLMCMSFEDFLREFKPLVRQIDPYQAVFQSLIFTPNPLMHNEDTTVYISRAHFLQSSHINTANGNLQPPPSFQLHRTLPPELAEAIRMGRFADVLQLWNKLIEIRPTPAHRSLLANEILHFSIWFGQVTLACFAIERCDADVDSADDTGLTPLHFSVMRNQPEMVRLLLVYGADDSILGGRWNGSFEGLTPLDTAKNWKFCDTAAARVVLEREVCLFCNTRFDKLVIGGETCPRCNYRYCKRPHAMCIDKHQCPSDFRKREGIKTVGANSQDEDETPFQQEQRQRNHFDGSRQSDYCSVLRSSSTSISTLDQSRRSSLTRSASESSSLVFVNSPASICLSPNYQQMRQHHHYHVYNESRRGRGAVVRNFSGFFDHFNLISHKNPDDEDDVDSQSTRLGTFQVALQFPDRPEWYCNASGCHVVFAFFSHGLECCCCQGFFCTDHFHTKTKQCLRCETYLANKAEQTKLDGKMALITSVPT